MNQPSEDRAPRVEESWAESAQGRREALQDEGYYGTLAGYLDWIRDTLMMGGFKLGEVEPDPRFSSRKMRKLSLVTAGFSTDERLLGRVHDSLLQSYWESSHSGGLYVYHIPVEHLEGDKPPYETQWLKPYRGVFNTVWRARTVKIYGLEGEYVEIDSPHGAELAFSEDEDLRWTAHENGVLEVRALGENALEEHFG